MRKFVGLVAIGLIVNACSVFGSTEPTRLSYKGRSTVLSANPVSVDAVVTVRNTGNTTTNINAGQCLLYIAAYTTPGREGDPVWASGGKTAICPAVALTVALAPGDYFDYRVRATLPAFARGRQILSGDAGRGWIPAGADRAGRHLLRIPSERLEDSGKSSGLMKTRSKERVFLSLVPLDLQLAL